ncbi:MAG: hypothetical protein ACI4W7_07875 [Candidatus Spyradenecus sp.]
MEAGKWYQVGCPFVSLDGTESVKLNECFIEGFALEDTLMILDVENSYYDAMLYWVPEKKAWCNLPIAAIATPSEKVLKPGQAVYIYKKTAGNVIVSGQVKAVEASFGSANGNQWAQVCIVWPEEKALNSLQWTNLALGDTLQVLNVDSASYDAMLYWVPEKQAWCDLPIAAIATPSNKVLTPGQAVYIYKASQGVGTVKVQE